MNRSAFVAATAAVSAASALPIRGTAQAALDVEYDLTTPTGTIFGTLLAPVSAAPVPVALIIAGSGPTDRNGNAPSLALNMYRKLATALAAAGIATVRYDKRGIAGSSAALASESDLRFGTFADDAAAWIAKLRGDGRFSRVAVIGHSEGSLLGMLAVQQTAADSFISLEGAGFRIDAIMRTQMQAQLQPYPDLAASFEMILTALVAGNTVANVPQQLMALFRPSIQPYLISWLAYDPRIEIAKLTGRVTIVQGTHDIQTPVADGKALATARPSATYVLVNGMTHVLTDDTGTTLEQQLSGAYVDATRPLDLALVRALITAIQPERGHR